MIKLFSLFILGATTSAIFFTNNFTKQEVQQENLWQKDNNGIKTSNKEDNIGIKTNSDAITALKVNGDVDGVYEGNAGMFYSNSLWHTALALKNNSSNSQFTFLVAGEENRELRPNNFAISNGNFGVSRFSMVVDAESNNVGFGYNNTVTTKIPSAVTIYNGDVNMATIGTGFIMKSPNGKCWRVTIDNYGNFIKKAIKCP